jgi:hypothetical protein
MFYHETKVRIYARYAMPGAKDERARRQKKGNIRPAIVAGRKTNILKSSEANLIGLVRMDRMKRRKYMKTEILNMLIGPESASSSLRLAVHGSAVLWRRAKDKTPRERHRITRRTRLTTRTVGGISIAMACAPLRYAPPRSER